MPAPARAPDPRNLNRRTVLQGLATAPLLVAAGAGTTIAADNLVLHQGWVLRADDLVRLGRA